jgi:hypothetical protein
VALLTLTNAALGQERVTIAGAVVDSLGRPVPGVSVMVDGTDVRMVTGTDGGFRLVVEQPDNVTLVVSRTGWVTRRLGVSFAGGERGTRDVGSIAFYPVPGRFAVIRGRLREEGSGEPLAAVIVSLNGQALAMSDEAGEFSLTARVQSGRNALEFRRIGYEDTRYLFELRPGETEVDVEQSLAAAAVRLTDLEVREEAMARHLATFIRHRDQGLGYFWDAEEIEELEPVVVSDVVRRVPGARVITGETPVAWTDADFLAGRPPTGVETTINFHRLGNPERHPCLPLYFVDGIAVASTDIDRIARPDRIAGLEVYSSPTQIPPEYNRRGSACGVIAMWTKEGGFVDERSPLRVGFQLGGDLRSGVFRRGRLGVTLGMQFVGGLEFAPGVNVLADLPGNSPETGWQLLFTVRGRPLGEDSPWYLGGGATLFKIKRPDRPQPPATFAPVFLTGLSTEFHILIPFVELHVVDFVSEDVTPMVFTGFAIEIGRN